MSLLSCVHSLWRRNPGNQGRSARPSVTVCSIYGPLLVYRFRSVECDMDRWPYLLGTPNPGRHSAPSGSWRCLVGHVCHHVLKVGLLVCGGKPRKSGFILLTVRSRNPNKLLAEYSSTVSPCWSWDQCESVCTFVWVPMYVCVTDR